MKTELNKSRRRGRDAVALPSPESIGIGRAGQPCPAVFPAAQAVRPYLLKCLCIKSSGFTLLEVLIATALFGLVVAGTVEVYIMCNKLWHATSISMQTVRESSLALSRIVYGLETNKGLRAASMILLQTTNVYGHPYPFTATNKYWETGAKPPSATDTAHYTHVGCGYGTDGSWRLIVSNVFDGVTCVDYNSKMRNILFCPDTNQTAAARQKRILICNYVSNAQVTTNASGTVTIQVTVSKQDGMFTSSNTVSTTVKMRNKP